MRCGYTPRLSQADPLACVRLDHTQGLLHTPAHVVVKETPGINKEWQNGLGALLRSGL